MARQVRPSAQRQVQWLRPARFPALRWGSLLDACFLGSLGIVCSSVVWDGLGCTHYLLPKRFAY